MKSRQLSNHRRNTIALSCQDNAQLRIVRYHPFSLLSSMCWWGLGGERGMQPQSHRSSHLTFRRLSSPMWFAGSAPSSLSSKSGIPEAQVMCGRTRTCMRHDTTGALCRQRNSGGWCLAAPLFAERWAGAVDADAAGLSYLTTSPDRQAVWCATVLRASSMSPANLGNRGWTWKQRENGIVGVLMWIPPRVFPFKPSVAPL